MPGYSVIQDPLRQQPIPEDGILTRQFFEDDKVRCVLFTFSSEQRLSEHTASSPALLYFMNGEATVSLGQDVIEAVSGTWIRMDAGLPHSIITRSPVVMLLVLIKGASKNDEKLESISVYRPEANNEMGYERNRHIRNPNDGVIPQGRNGT